ncbi:MAG: hypothetical protein ABIW79_01115 [Gemmatimonas sp.]
MNTIPGTMIKDKTYLLNFDFTVNLAAGESLFLFMAFKDGSRAQLPSVKFVSTDTFISTKTKGEPIVVYGLRPLDLAQQLVSKATKGRFTINSEFFTINNKAICVSGDAIRGVPNAKLYSSFSDFFNTFDALFFMALRSINDKLWIEPAIEVYNARPTGLPVVTHTIIDLGDAIDLKLEPAIEYMGNEIEVGSPKQDYRHPSGRLEFNSVNTFSMDVDVKKRFSWITRYRLDGYGVQFLILDYQGQSSEDNSGDKDVFVLDTTDELGSALDNVESFENISINNIPLAPIIKSPLNTDSIKYNRPRIRGVAPVGSTINIYVDSIFDGTTTTDSFYNWSYNIVTALSSYNPGVASGIHIIKATYTDLSATFDEISIEVDTTVACPIEILYPENFDNLYNSKPLIKGIAPYLTNISIVLDGVVIGNVVADQSCNWEFKVTTPIIFGIHTLTANGASSFFTVESNVSFPLITYVGSELDGFPLVNNLPLIQGVGIAGTVVEIWLNYIRYSYLGTTIIGADGTWSFQVVPVVYLDPVGNNVMTLAPIQNGLNIFSTSLINQSVQVNTRGYKLNRPSYNSITGVPDNTVINTRFSPQRMLEAHYPMLAAIRPDKIQFQTADKNAALSTVLGTEVIVEHADIQGSELGAPLAVLEIVTFKTKVLNSFAKTLRNFNSGGVIKTNFRGTNIYMLPIGGMKIASISDTIQEWRLLVSPLTTYTQLLNLYKQGLTITIMKNSFYHSDYNPLHFVEYNYSQPTKYNYKTIYQDWFNNRNDSWLQNPEYVQKFQKSEIIRDQIITNGISGIVLRMYRCSDIFLLATINYNPVAPAPIPVPDIVMEAIIDFSLYPEDKYFFVQVVNGVEVAISEVIETRIKWGNTILVESTNSINYTGIFFSTGFKTILRVEGHIKKVQPNVFAITETENDGDSQLVYSSISRKRVIRFGTAFGLPDYLAMKMSLAITTDNFVCEGVGYAIEDGEKINPSEDVDGHPMFYYNVNVLLKQNQRGIGFNGVAGGSEADRQGVVLVIDATAIGLPTGTIISINLD